PDLCLEHGRECLPGSWFQRRLGAFPCRLCSIEETPDLKSHPCRATMLMSRGRHVNDSIPDFRVYLVTKASQAQKYRFSCSTSVLLLADGVLQTILLFKQAAERSEIEIKVCRRQIKILRELVNLPFQLHQGFAHLFNLLVGQRPPFHAADRLAFEQLAEQLNQAQHEFRQPLLDVLRGAINSPGKPFSSIGKT